MYIYEVSVLLLWYGLWNLLDELYKFLSHDKELIGSKYKFWNILVLIVAVYLLSKCSKK